VYFLCGRSHTNAELTAGVQVSVLIEFISRKDRDEYTAVLLRAFRKNV
jgi:hypothetical protein